MCNTGGHRKKKVIKGISATPSFTRDNMTDQYETKASCGKNRECSRKPKHSKGTLQITNRDCNI